VTDPDAVARVEKFRAVAAGRAAKAAPADRVLTRALLGG